MKKRFYQYVLPSMLAFAFSGLYSIVDGLFVGKNIGDAGLSAINFAYPLVVLIQATGTGLGLGGAVEMAIATGQKNEKRKRLYLGNTLVLLLISCMVLTIVLGLGNSHILALFGAEGDSFHYAKEYLYWITLGATFQILANGLGPILRNFGHPMLVMVAMIGGFVTNIILDWLFIPILGLGMKGAAIATIIGQFTTMVPCLWVLVPKK